MWEWDTEKEWRLHIPVTFPDKKGWLLFAILMCGSRGGNPPPSIGISNWTPPPPPPLEKLDPTWKMLGLDTADKTSWNCMIFNTTHLVPCRGPHFDPWFASLSDETQNVLASFIIAFNPALNKSCRKASLKLLNSRWYWHLRTRYIFYTALVFYAAFMWLCAKAALKLHKSCVKAGF